MSSGSERIPHTEGEKMLLASLVDKHKNVLENKKTDATTIQEKNAEWKKVAEEYNAQATLISIKLTDAQLKKLWNNLKQRKRKATTELKYQRLLTGGGPEPSQEEDPVMEAVSIAYLSDYNFFSGIEYDGLLQEIENEQEPEPEHVFLPATFASSGNITPRTSTVITPRTSTVITPRTSTVITPRPSTVITPRTSTVTRATLTSTETQSASTRLCSETGQRGVTRFVKTESNLRVQRVQESIQQQEELHNIRLQIENEQLQTAIAARRKAELEAELAELHLRLFKEQHQF